VKLKSLTYRNAGVDIARGDEATRRIKKLVKQTYNRQVLNEIGSFGGCFSGRFEGYAEPVLVSSADSVGTKLKLAFMTGVHDTVGQDIVNHCTNDILVHGARPLFFLDYFATSKLEPDVVSGVVSGMARACKANGCALIGGETAELPEFYRKGEYDLAGFIVGVVDKRDLIDGSKIKPGDIIIGLSSSGLHTNGYSLARKLFFDRLKLKPASPVAELGCTVADALMAVHRSYLKPILKVRESVAIHGLAHITGGGIPGNLVRVLPRACQALIDRTSWTPPALFKFIQTKGNVVDKVMFETFNMGIGMTMALDPADASKALKVLRQMRVPSRVIGAIVKGNRGVVIE
jgi:phosphoribosylformylglycinamidine cyclo-ligase